MSEPNAKLVISAIDETKKGVQDAKRNIQNLAKDIAGIDLKKAFSVAGVVSGTIAAVKAVGKAIKDCSKEFMEADAAATRFKAIWENVGATTGKTSRQVMKLADSIELSSDFTAEAVLEASQLLAATEKLSDEGFDRAIQASADLAASMGTDVTNAAQTLAKALQDPESGLQSLKTAGVTFTDSEKDLIKKLQEEGDTWKAQEIILQKVEDRYQGVSKAINNTPLGTLNNIEDVLGSIKESFGEAFVNALSPALEDIYGWLLKIKTWIDNYNDEKTDRKEILSALRTGGSLAGWTNEELAAWGNKFLADREAKWNDNPFTANLSPYALKNMSAQQMWEAYGVDLSSAVSEYFEFEGYWEKIVDELENRMLGESSAKALEDAAKAVAALGAKGRSRTGVDMDPETWLYNLAGEFEGKGLKTSQLGSNGALLPYFDQSLIGKLDPTPVVKSLDEVAEQLRAKTIVNYYQNKGQNSQDYWERMQVAYNNGKGNTMGGRAVTITLPPKVEESLTRVVDSVDEAIEYIQSDAMMNKWKDMTERGKRERLAILESVLEETAVQGSYMDIAGIQWKGKPPVEDDVLIEAISNMIDMLDGAAGALADLVASAGPLGIIIWMVNEVFEAFMSQMNDLINQALAPFTEVLHWIGRELANVFAPILDLVGRWLTLIGNILQTVLGPVISLIAAPLKMIAGILDFLTPVLEGIAKTFVILAAPVQWLADLFMWLGDTLQTFVHNITHPFSKEEYTKYEDAVGTKAFEEAEEKLKLIESLGGGVGEIVTTGASSTGLANASYSGGGSVTINIYQQAPMVGSDGMTQFAQMIRAEFEELNYYSV